MRLAFHDRHLAQTSAGVLEYLLFQPPGPIADPRPGILFLHGAGERGGAPSRVARLGLPAEIEGGRNLPFVVVSPHCPKGRDWESLTRALLELLAHATEKHAIHPEHVYLTGISMGGFGAWKLASEAPEAFAALAPVCGGGDPAWAPRLRELPTWAFHGALDDLVPPRRSREMTDALERISAPVRLTIYDDLGHDCWTRTYQRDDLYDWFLGQRRDRTAGISGQAPPGAPLAETLVREERAMARVQRSVRIETPVEQVYAYLTSPTNLPEIWPSLLEVRKVDAKPSGEQHFDWSYKMAGLRFNGHSDTIEVAPHEHVVLKSEAGISSTFDWRYEREDGATKVTLTVEYTLPGKLLSKLVAPLVERVNAQEAETMLRNAKVKLEHRERS